MNLPVIFSKMRPELLLCMILFSVVYPLWAQQPLNELAFKATHNSYACCGGVPCFFCDWSNDCPVMHNPPDEQIDDWGVWGLELDFGVVMENSAYRLIVGHDGPSGDKTWSDLAWGKYLDDFLLRIRDSRSLDYRPVFIYFERKTHQKNSSWPNLDHIRVAPLLDSLLIKVFGEANVFGPRKLDSLKDLGKGWQTVPELAGKVIPVVIRNEDLTAEATSLIFLNAPTGLERVGPPGDKGFDQYTDSATMESEKNGRPGHPNGAGIILASDQYQDSWSFSLCTPPNPVYVSKSGLFPFYVVTNTIGHACTGCTQDPKDIGCTFIVNQQGTFRFPYRNITSAVNRALPGWTILIKAGSYPVSMEINKNVILKADGGIVTIGQ